MKILEATILVLGSLLPMHHQQANLILLSGLKISHPLNGTGNFLTYASSKNDGAVDPANLLTGTAMHIYERSRICYTCSIYCNTRE